MQEQLKFCGACGRGNHISAACCYSCNVLFADVQNIKFKGPDHDEKPRRVIVVDFDMKFSSMVFFMVKWAIAAIPALIILLIIGILLPGILIGIGGGPR